MYRDHTNTAYALAQDAQSVNGEVGSVTTIRSDFSISESVLQTFADAFGRDSRILTRERSGRTDRENFVPVSEQSVTRRQSRGSSSGGSIAGITIGRTDREHTVPVGEQAATRRQSRGSSGGGSIAGITIDVAGFEDDSEDAEALDNDTNTVGHDCGVELDGSIHRITSDLSMCSILEDEVATTSQLQVETQLQNSSSLMSGQHISDREVKAGTISRTLSIGIGKSGQHKPRRTISYHHKSLNHVSSCLSIDENAEVTCRRNASFEDLVSPNLSQVCTRSSAVSLMGHALFNVQSLSLYGKHLNSHSPTNISRNSERSTAASSMGRVLLDMPSSSVAGTRLNSNISLDPLLNSQRSTAASSMGHALLNMLPTSNAGTYTNPHTSPNLLLDCQRTAAASSMGRAFLDMPLSS